MTQRTSHQVPGEELRRRLSFALAQHRHGQLQGAQEIYRQVLQDDPHCFDALHLLGTALADGGRVNEGIDFIRRALAVDPSQAHAHYSLAQALLAKGDLQAALTSLDRSTTLQPGHADAWFLSGNVLQAMGRLEESARGYERAIELRPSFAEAFSNLSVVLRSLRLAARALQRAEQALLIRPDYAKALNNRGLILLDARKGGEAVESFRRAIAIEPLFLEATNPTCFDVWARLLKSVPGSVLWLLEAGTESEHGLRREATARGVDAARLIFAPRVAYDEYLARYALADLVVDTFPYNGGTTVSDALFMGVPVVTCSGESFAARMAGSILTTLGLPELIGESLPDSEAIARELAINPTKLAALRARLRDMRQQHPFFDTDRYRQHLEAAYRMMWKRHWAGLPPESFSVRPLDG